LRLDDDAATVRCGLELLKLAVLAIEPFARSLENLTKIGLADAHVDDPHSGFPEKVLVAAA
jgi:hypothetical protein